MDDQQWSEMLHKFKYQAGHSIVWRDAINNFVSFESPSNQNAGW